MLSVAGQGRLWCPNARAPRGPIRCEGDPHLVGELLGAGLLDELFPTLAPQVAGRDDATKRLALVEGTSFDIATAPWAELRSVRRSGDHLFLRYRIGAAAGRAG